MIASGRKARIGRALAVLALLLSAAAGASPEESEGAGGPKDYVIGEGDVLRVSVWKSPDLDAVIPVRPDGMISVPLVGDVSVAGLKPVEVEKVLTELFAEWVRVPKVSVVVQEIHSRKVYILGEVQQPGVYDLQGPLRVMQALAAAGGLTAFAKRERVILLRETHGWAGPRRPPDLRPTKRLKLNLKAVRSGRRPQDNILLRPGDTIIVP